MQKPPKANNKWWAPIPAEQGIKYGTHYWDQRGALVTENLVGDDSRVIIDRVLPFFDQHAKNSQPFFAVIWLHAPHLPVVSGKQYTERYANYSKYEQPLLWLHHRSRRSNGASPRCLEPAKDRQ